jgi:hypothetical protein
VLLRFALQHFALPTVSPANNLVKIWWKCGFFRFSNNPQSYLCCSISPCNISSFQRLVLQITEKKFGANVDFWFFNNPFFLLNRLFPFLINLRQPSLPPGIPVQLESSRELPLFIGAAISILHLQATVQDRSIIQIIKVL